MIISINSGGLGNRLKSWVSAMRLAPDAGVYWKITRHMPAGFSQLFANTCSFDKVPTGFEVHNSWRLAVLPGDESHLPAGFSTAGAGAHPVIRALGKMWWLFWGKPDDQYQLYGISKNV